jgi:hypothetical protein
MADIEEQFGYFYENRGKLFHDKQTARKWFDLMVFVKNDVIESIECATECCQLEDEFGYIFSSFVDGLNECGVKFPQEFPKELDFDYIEHDNHVDDDLEEDESPEYEEFAIGVIEEHPLGRAISEFVRNYLYLNSFKLVFVDPIFESNSETEYHIDDFDFYIVDLAVAHLDLSELNASNHEDFKSKTKEDFDKLFDIVMEESHSYNNRLRHLFGLMLKEDPYTLEIYADDRLLLNSVQTKTVEERLEDLEEEVINLRILLEDLINKKED